MGSFLFLISTMIQCKQWNEENGPKVLSAKWKPARCNRNCPRKRWYLGLGCWQQNWEHFSVGWVLTLVPRRQARDCVVQVREKESPEWPLPCRITHSSYTGSLGYTWSMSPSWNMLCSAYPGHYPMSFLYLPSRGTKNINSFSSEIFQKTSSSSCLNLLLGNYAFS